METKLSAIDGTKFSTFVQPALVTPGVRRGYSTSVHNVAVAQFWTLIYAQLPTNQPTSAADSFETPQVLKVYSYLCYLESTNGNPWLPWSPWLPRFPKQLNLAFTTVLGLESNNTDFRVIFSGFRFCYRGSGEFWDLERKVATIFCDRLDNATVDSKIIWENRNGMDSRK
jgi:hypothetical protein